MPQWPSSNQESVLQQQLRTEDQERLRRPGNFQTFHEDFCSPFHRHKPLLKTILRHAFYYTLLQYFHKLFCAAFLYLQFVIFCPEKSGKKLPVNCFVLILLHFRLHVYGSKNQRVGIRNGLNSLCCLLCSCGQRDTTEKSKEKIIIPAFIFKFPATPLSSPSAVFLK